MVKAFVAFVGLSGVAVAVAGVLGLAFRVFVLAAGF